MHFRMDQVDEVSVLATQYIKEEFALFEQDDPPEITPGMTRNVIKALFSISDANRKAEERCCNCAYWHKRGEKCAACHSTPE